VIVQAHRCDDDCTCPIHGTPLLYAPASDAHACQDPDCEHAHGFALYSGPIFVDVAVLRAARDLALVAPPEYQRAWAAADDFTACMDRLVTEAAPSPESIDRLKAAILSMAEPDPGCGETT
jgi:hypothetical protein